MCSSSAAARPAQQLARAASVARGDLEKLDPLGFCGPQVSNVVLAT
jgi:hypothetical protein